MTKPSKRRTQPPHTVPSKHPRAAGARSARYRFGVIALVILVLVAGVVGWTVWSRPHGPLPPTLAHAAAAGSNVLLVTLDTTRADHLGCYGDRVAQTPVLDRLAAEGIRFADAVSPVPITLPAHVSIMTGLDPPHHGVRNNGEYQLDDSHVTLAELLRDADYDTAAFVSSFVLDARYRLDQGFALYDDRVEATAQAAFGGYENERTAGTVTSAALKWLRNRTSDKPFFLWVHYYDPHSEYQPPQPYATTFRANPYDGEIAYMDAELGRLVDALGELGRADRTVTIIAGDHGESLGEHDEEGHTHLIYAATQHVPLILWSPALVDRGGVVDNVVVGIVDIFPTVLDLLGLSHSGPCDGMTLLRAPEQPERMVYMETLVPYLANGWAPLYGLRRHGDKHIAAPKPEYYNLLEDPHELKNLYVGLSGSAQRAAAELALELAVRLEDSPSAEAVAAAALALDPQSRQRLEALGYVGGGARSTAAAETLPDPKDMMPAWKLYHEAQKLVRAGRYDQALAKTREALQQSPNDSAMSRQLGEIYLATGRFQDAVTPFQSCLDARFHVDIALMQAQALLNLERSDEARALAQRVLAIDAEHGGALLVLGDILARQGKLKKSIERYEEAARVDPYRAAGAAKARIAKVRRALAPAAPP
jgi:choline-sulfatase